MLTFNRRKRFAMRLAAEFAPAHRSLVKVCDAAAVDEFDCSWKLPTRDFPYSCTVEEGMILYEVIASNRLRAGFEIATAFGFSALFAAAAFKPFDGELQTVDCYVEESTGSFIYSEEEMKRAVALVRHRVAAGELPVGLATARALAESMHLSSVIKFHVGLSPDDVPAILSTSAIDYALIDGGHFENQPTKDFLAVAPNLADRCAVFFHDNNDNPSVSAAIEVAEAHIGVRAHRFNTRYGLTLVGRGLSPDTFSAADRLCKRNGVPYRLANRARPILSLPSRVRRRLFG